MGRAAGTAVSLSGDIVIDGGSSAALASAGAVRVGTQSRAVALGRIDTVVTVAGDPVSNTASITGHLRAASLSMPGALSASSVSSVGMITAQGAILGTSGLSSSFVNTGVVTAAGSHRRSH